MKKMYLEIITAIGSVVMFIALIVMVTIFMGKHAGYGYTIALLVYTMIMGIAGLKLAEIPDNGKNNSHQ